MLILLAYNLARTIILLSDSDEDTRLKTKTQAESSLTDMAFNITDIAGKEDVAAVGLDLREFGLSGRSQETSAKSSSAQEISWRHDQLGSGP